MKVAVYEESLIFGVPDHFVEIIDCDGPDELTEPGEPFAFDEDGKCPYNDDCSSEDSARYDGYATSRKYCISIDKHNSRKRS